MEPLALAKTNMKLLFHSIPCEDMAKSQESKPNLLCLIIRELFPEFCRVNIAEFLYSFCGKPVWVVCHGEDHPSILAALGKKEGLLDNQISARIQP